MTILVVGGSSQIGHFLLPRLAAGGERIVALSRIPRPARDGVEWLHGALPHAVPSLPPLSAIISFGPLQALADWLAAACARHGCAWTVLRPTLVYGAGLDRSLTPIARRALRTRLFPIPSGRGLRQPVHADDIAMAVLAALECPAAAGRVLSIGGGERLACSQMFARVRRSLPRATVPVRLPAWLLRLGRQMCPPLRGPLSRLDSDLVADNDELQRLLHVQPRPFQPEAAMWVESQQAP